MVSVTSASGYITPASRYHQRYQSRSSMFIRGLIPRNFAELAEAVPIEIKSREPYLVWKNMTKQCSVISSMTDSLVPCLHDPIFRNLDRRGISDYIGEMIIPELRIMRLTLYGIQPHNPAFCTL